MFLFSVHPIENDRKIVITDTSGDQGVRLVGSVESGVFEFESHRCELHPFNFPICLSTGKIIGRIR